MKSEMEEAVFNANRKLLIRIIIGIAIILILNALLRRG
jgi:hypothetical protein